MTQDRLEDQFARWQAAGLLEAGQVERLRAYEKARQGHPRLRWPVLMALAAGGLMLGAGVLLFVAAHWDTLSPAFRFGLVLIMVAGFHGVAVVATGRFDALAVTFRTLGTAALGAGIFLAAQIFNLQEHWPTAFLLWAIGAAAGWVLLREWPQAGFTAVLIPIWLIGEWVIASEGHTGNQELVPASGVLLLALAYLWAPRPDTEDLVGRVLAVLGAVSLIPATVALMVWRSPAGHYLDLGPLPPLVAASGAAIAVAGPLLVGVVLRGREAWPLVPAALWVLLGAAIPEGAQLLPYLWCAGGALGVVAAGARSQRRLDINVGMLGFGLTVLAFYFSSVMDRLGRSASLMAGGALFLLGGWALDRLRRRLLARALPPRRRAP